MTPTSRQTVVKANGAEIPAIGFGTWELRGEICARIVAEGLKGDSQIEMRLGGLRSQADCFAIERARLLQLARVLGAVALGN